MAKVTEEQRAEAISHFRYEGEPVSVSPYGSGHINDTFLLEFECGERERAKIILQRMNRAVFEKPVELMENITGVTSHLRRKIVENGGDPERETLNVMQAEDGKPYYKDSLGDYWRSYKFITDATSIFIRVRWHSAIFRGSLRIIRQRRCMRRLRVSMTQRPAFGFLKKQWRRTLRAGRIL